MKTICHVVVLAVCCGTLGAQQIWKVSTNPTVGAHFSDLPPAVAAAAPGDTIWVYTVYPTMGFGNLYTAPAIDKPLTIIGFNVGVAPGNNTPGAIGLQGALTITNIPPGSQVVMTNIVMGLQWPLASTVLVSNCAGSVVLDDFFWHSVGLPDRTVQIENCADVIVRGSEFWLSTDAIEIRDSNVLMTTCWVAPSTGWGSYTSTSESIFLQNSNLTIAGSVVRSQAPLSAYNQPSRNAVVLDNSTLRIGPTTLVRGGYISGTPGTLPIDFIPACLLTGTGTNEVIHDPRSPETNYGPVQPTVTWQHEVIHDWVVGDELFHVKVMGPPGGFALLALGDYVPWLQTATPGAAVDGHLALDPLTGYGVSLVPLNPATGHYDWTFLCPGMAENGHAFVLQALTLSPQSTFGWTIPSPLTVGWDKDRVP